MQDEKYSKLQLLKSALFFFPLSFPFPLAEVSVLQKGFYILGAKTCPLQSGTRLGEFVRLLCCAGKSSPHEKLRKLQPSGLDCALPSRLEPNLGTGNLMEGVGGLAGAPALSIPMHPAGC